MMFEWICSLCFRLSFLIVCSSGELRFYINPSSDVTQVCSFLGLSELVILIVNDKAFSFDWV